jgi:hypothetical protein
VLKKIEIERDSSFCLWTPNVHDSIIDNISISLDRVFSISFNKSGDRYILEVINFYYYGINDFNNNSGVSEIFIGNIDELSSLEFPNHENPWILANPIGLNKIYLDSRKSNIQNTSIILFIICEEGGYVSIVGESILSFKIT